MFRQIHIVNGGRIQIDRMEALRRAVDHFQSRRVLNGQIDQQRPMRQIAETLQSDGDR